MVKAITLSQIGTLALVVVFVIRVFPDNHTSFDVRYLHFSWVAALVASMLAAFSQDRSRKRLSLSRPIVACIALCLVTATAIWAADYFNFVVQYDRWLKRGMPDSPLRSLNR